MRFRKKLVRANSVDPGYEPSYQDLLCLYRPISKSVMLKCLTLKAPITTAADDKFCSIFPIFLKKQGVILHENCLPADNSHEISCLIC